MKGISPLVGFVLVIAISVSAIAIAMNVGNPAIERSQEILIYNEGINNLKLIDSAINEVMQEGDGSSRKVNLKVTDGIYNVYSGEISFTMTTNQGIVADGVEKEEDGVNIEADNGEILMYIDYSFSINGDNEYYSGSHEVFVINENGKITFK